MNWWSAAVQWVGTLECNVSTFAALVIGLSARQQRRLVWWRSLDDTQVHGVWFAPDGEVRYRNRWVQTRGLEAEERAGRALFGGLMTPAFVDPSLLGDDPDPGWPSKLDAFINIVRHAGRYLALEDPPRATR